MCQVITTSYTCTKNFSWLIAKRSTLKSLTYLQHIKSKAIQLESSVFEIECPSVSNLESVQTPIEILKAFVIPLKNIKASLM